MSWRYKRQPTKRELRALAVARALIPEARALYPTAIAHAAEEALVPRPRVAKRRSLLLDRDDAARAALVAKLRRARGEGFPATRMELHALTRITFPTITDRRNILLKRGFIRLVTADTYAINDNLVASPKILDSRESREKKNRKSKSERSKGEGGCGGKGEGGAGNGIAAEPTRTEKRLAVRAALGVLRVRDGGSSASSSSRRLRAWCATASR